VDPLHRLLGHRGIREHDFSHQIAARADEIAQLARAFNEWPAASDDFATLHVLRRSTKRS